MLVLRRRVGESLLIGDQIEIEILESNAHGAKIGIRAPRETLVLRKELKITQEQNTAAAEIPAPADLERALKNFRRTTQEGSIRPDKHLES